MLPIDNGETMETNTFEILRVLDACWRHDGRLKEAEVLIRMHPRDAWASLLSRYPDDAVWLWETLDLGRFPVKCARQVAARATAWLAAETGLVGMANAIVEALGNDDHDGVYWALNDVWGEAPSYSALSTCALAARSAYGECSLGAECIKAAEDAVGYSMPERGCVLVFNVVFEHTYRDLVAAWAMWLFDEGFRIDISRA